MTTPTSTPLRLNPDETALWREWSAATRTLQAALDRILTERVELALVEFEMLTELVMRGCAIRSCDLGASVALTRSGATRAIARLEKAGLVRKVPSETDGRSVLVELTELGAKRHACASNVFEVVVRRDFFDALDTLTAADRASLLASLTAVRSAVESGPICQEALARAVEEGNAQLAE